MKTLVSSLEPKAHKVSLKFTNSPSSSKLSNLNISEASWPSWSNFMCSITGVGDKVFGQIGSRNLVSMATESPPLIYNGENDVTIFSRFFFYPILFILAGNEDMHKILEEFEFWPDRTTDYGVSCPWPSKKFPIDL